MAKTEENGNQSAVKTPKALMSELNYKQTPQTEKDKMTTLVERYQNLNPEYNFIQINCDLKKGSTKDRESHTVRYFDLDELRSLVFNSRFNNISFSEFDDITKVPNKNNWQAIAWSNAI